MGLEFKVRVRVGVMVRVMVRVRVRVSEPNQLGLSRRRVTRDEL